MDAFFIPDLFASKNPLSLGIESASVLKNSRSSRVLHGRVCAGRHPLFASPPGFSVINIFLAQEGLSSAWRASAGEKKREDPKIRISPPNATSSAAATTQSSLSRGAGKSRVLKENDEDSLACHCASHSPVPPSTKVMELKRKTTQNLTVVF